VHMFGEQTGGGGGARDMNSGCEKRGDEGAEAGRRGEGGTLTEPAFSLFAKVTCLTMCCERFHSYNNTLPPATLYLCVHVIVQVTVFMALLVLDAKRLSQSRLDCLPCLRVPYRDATGAWVHDDVNSDDYDTDNGYTPALPGPLNPASGLLTGLNRALGRGGVQGSAGTGQEAGEVYYPPQQELPPVPGQQQQQQQQQHGGGGGYRGVVGMGEGVAGGSNRLGVLPGVTKSGPGLLHGDRISLQSLLQVGDDGGRGLLVCVGGWGMGVGWGWGGEGCV